MLLIYDILDTFTEEGIRHSLLLGRRVVSNSVFEVLLAAALDSKVRERLRNYLYSLALK